MNASKPTIAKRRGPTRGRLGLRRPAERGPLDALAGITLWLTLLHGATGAGVGVLIGSLAL